jgi:hypothetical protein
MNVKAFYGDVPTPERKRRLRGQPNAPRTVTCNSGNDIGRPGEDKSADMVATVKNGTRVRLNGIRVSGSGEIVSIVGYVSNVKAGVAKIETWGALPNPVFLPVSALAFDGIAHRKSAMPVANRRRYVKA